MTTKELVESIQPGLGLEAVGVIGHVVLTAIESPHDQQLGAAPESPE